MSFRKLVLWSECEKQNGRVNVTTVAVTVSRVCSRPLATMRAGCTWRIQNSIDQIYARTPLFRSGYKSSFTYKVPVNYMQAVDTIPTVTNETRTPVLQILIIALRRPILISTHCLIRKHKRFTKGSRSQNKNNIFKKIIFFVHTALQGTYFKTKGTKQISFKIRVNKIYFLPSYSCNILIYSEIKTPFLAQSPKFLHVLL